MKPTITAREHYDRLAESGHGRDDPPVLREYMARWDGPLFREALGDLGGKDVLEVGIGFGRIARQVLEQGCRSLTGLDISPKTIAAAMADLAEFPQVELVLADISDFVRPGSFDAAFSVLTMMHVRDKRRALQNIVDSLRPGGHLVLSIDNASDSLDFGKWTVTLYPWAAERYAETLRYLGCEVADPIPLIDTWVDPKGEKSDTYGEVIATLIRANRG
jgi:SAM-dependent methyltransferase